MINFFNLADEKELKEELALTDSSDLIQYISDLDPDKQEKFLLRLEKIFGDGCITLMKEGIKYLKERKSNKF